MSLKNNFFVLLLWPKLTQPTKNWKISTQPDPTQHNPTHGQLWCAQIARCFARCHKRRNGSIYAMGCGCLCVCSNSRPIADRIVCIAMHSRLYKMRAIAAHVAWSASLCVCLLITSMHHAKAGEPIEMPFKSKILLAHETMYYIGRARIPHRRRHMTLWGGTILGHVNCRQST